MYDEITNGLPSDDHDDIEQNEEKNMKEDPSTFPFQVKRFV